MKRKKARRTFTDEEREAFIEQYDSLLPVEHAPWLNDNGFSWQTINRFRRALKAAKKQKPVIVEVQGLPLEEAVKRLEVQGLPLEEAVKKLEAPSATRELLAAYVEVKRSEYRMLGKFLNELEGLLQLK